MNGWRRRKARPITRLAIAMRVAAREIANPTFRKNAARDAQSIPVEPLELGGGRKGELARLGRRTLAGLQHLAPEQWAETQVTLRACADAIVSRFEETSVITLGDKRRRQRA